MGWKIRLVAVALLLGLALPGKAQDEGSDGKKWTLTAGAFIPWDDTLCDVDTETGFTLALFHKVRETEKDAILGFFRYTRFDLANDQWVDLYSPMIEYRLTTPKPFYFSVAAGTVFGANNNGGHTWSAAYEVGAGWNVSSSFVLEARMIRGTKRGEHGFAISAGIKL